MKSIVSRLLHSQSSLPKLYAVPLAGNGRLFTTDSNKVDEPFKVEEAETINVPPPPSEKLLVLGGNGFVGSNVCKEALDRGLSVSSLSRSGRASINESWANNVDWHKGDLLAPDSLTEVLKDVTAVISCVGAFGSNSYMYKIAGTANINAIRAAAEQGVKRFVYISAADLGVANYLLKGYYEGKRAAETELLTRFPYAGVILRPGFIHGTRQVGGIKLPLGLVGAPLEMVLQHAKPLSRVPLVGPLLTPPVSVNAVAKVAVRAATDPVFPPVASEGTEREEVFDSLNLNPQLFINEVLNSVDDTVDGAFEFYEQKASEIVKEAVEEDKLDDLKKGVSSIRNVIQEVLDQRMGMWEKYCLRHCFAVPEGFSLPKARNSDDIVMDQDLLSDAELDHELDSLREKLYMVGKESSELQKELHDLKQQNSLSTSCADSVTEALQPYEQKSVHDMFEEMVKAAAKLHVKMENLKVKRSEKFNGIRTRKIYENAEDQFTVHRRKGFPEVELKDLQDFVADLKSL